MKKHLLFYVASLLFVGQACSQNKGQAKTVGGPCEDCVMMLEGMPASLSLKTHIAPAAEPGEPLIISGRIYGPDGTTPAPHVVLYVYHTDNTGLYSPSPNQTHAKRHGHLRGWVKSGADGRYEFETIRPASYPNRTDPQHIHALIKEPEISIYWIDEYLFEDDPKLTPRERSKQEKRGGPGIIQLKKNDKGIWVGKRDIILGLNIPDYQK